jgi:hypothetical protein
VQLAGSSGMDRGLRLPIATPAFTPGRNSGLPTRLGGRSSSDGTRVGHHLKTACQRGHRVRRRELMFVLGGTMAAARVVHAQQKATRSLGGSVGASLGPLAPYMAAFR